MSALLRLAPAWIWIALAGLVLVGLQQVRVSGAQESLAGFRAEVSERDRRAALAALQETKRRMVVNEEVEREAQEKLDSAQADADRAGDALGRLQQRYAEAERRARQCGNTVTAQLSETADRAVRVQADVFRRVGEAARFYAAEADRRGVAGRACEVAYSSLDRE